MLAGSELPTSLLSLRWRLIQRDRSALPGNLCSAGTYCESTCSLLSSLTFEYQGHLTNLHRYLRQRGPVTVGTTPAFH